MGNMHPNPTQVTGTGSDSGIVWGNMKGGAECFRNVESIVCPEYRAIKFLQFYSRMSSKVSRVECVHSV